MNKLMRNVTVVIISCVCGLYLCTVLYSQNDQVSQQTETVTDVRAFTGARLLIGNNVPVIENGVLVVRNGRIIAAGPAEEIVIPVEAEEIDLTEKTIIPGLINGHAHVTSTRGLESDPAYYTENNIVNQLTVYARYGVTTVLSLGGDGPAGIAVRDREDRNVSHASLYLAGPVVSANTPEEAVTQVDAVADLGANIVKIRVDDALGTNQKMSPAIYKAVINQAHNRGLRVAAHLFYLEDAKGLLEAGVDFLAHSVRDTTIDEELIALLIDKNVCYCPTLMREVSTYVYEERPDWFDDPFFLRDVDPTIVQALEAPEYQERIRNRPSSQAYKKALVVAQQNLKILADAGVRIAMGTDTGPAGRFQGYFEHSELQLMVDAGLTPMQTLVAATGEAARCLQIDNEVGTLEAGKWADFVVLSKNPLENIINTRTIETVWISGNLAHDFLVQNTSTQ
jgi:imidazolonepropionase-like amidohydrolase